MIKSFEEMKDKCRGFLLGTAIGDAMGVPFEGLPPIGNVPIDAFWEGFCQIPNEPEFLPGMTSDDTQLTAITMLSMHLSNGFNPENLAELFCKEFQGHRTIGWGMSTYHAVARMVYEGMPWDKCGSPEGSAGNGTAMRAGPFGLFPWKNKDDMIEAVIQSSKITHTDSAACAGALAIAIAHKYILNHENFSKHEFSSTIINEVYPLSELFGQTLEVCFQETDFLNALDALTQFGDEPENIETGKRGLSGYVVPSVAAALLVFSEYPHDPQKALGQVMLTGGDTDTIGSMVGGLIGSLNGAGIWPDHLSTNLHDYENLIVTADLFAQTCWEQMTEN